MLAEIKTEDGKIMAKRIYCEAWIRTPDKQRASNDLQIKVGHWINPEKMSCAFVLDQIAMKMLCDPLYFPTGHENLHFYSDRVSQARSKTIVYKNPVLMYSDNLLSGQWYLTNIDGNVLSGSNIFSNGHSYPGSLCLGSTVDGFNLSPIEALIFNEANRDLAWYGFKLTGSWNSQDQFEVTDWPPAERNIWTPPPQIVANANAWSRS